MISRRKEKSRFDGLVIAPIQRGLYILYSKRDTTAAPMPLTVDETAYIEAAFGNDEELALRILELWHRPFTKRRIRTSAIRRGRQGR